MADYTVDQIIQYLNKFDKNESLESVLKTPNSRVFFRKVYDSLLPLYHPRPSPNASQKGKQVTDKTSKSRKRALTIIFDEATIDPEEAVLRSFKRAAADPNTFWEHLGASSPWRQSRADVAAILGEAYAANIAVTSQLAQHPLRRRFFLIFFYLAAQRLGGTSQITDQGKKRLFEAIRLSGRVHPEPSFKELDTIIQQGKRYTTWCQEICEADELINEQFGVVLILPAFPLSVWEDHRRLAPDDIKTAAAHLRGLDILQKARDTGACEAAKAILDTALAPVSFRKPVSSCDPETTRSQQVVDDPRTVHAQVQPSDGQQHDRRACAANHFPHAVESPEPQAASRTISPSAGNASPEGSGPPGSSPTQRIPSHSGLRHDLINHSTHSQAPCNLAGAGPADRETYVARLESRLCLPSLEVQATSVERCTSPSENFTDQEEARPNKRRRKSGQHQTPQASFGALPPAEEENLTSDLGAIPIRQPAPGFDDFTPALLPVGLPDCPNNNSTADTMVASTQHWNQLFNASLNSPHNMFPQSNAFNTDGLDRPVLNSDADTISVYDFEQILAMAQ